MSDTLLIPEYLALHNLVALASVHKAYEFLDALAAVNVRAVVVPVGDGLPRLLQPADVDARGRARVVLEELSELIQLVPDVRPALVV